MDKSKFAYTVWQWGTDNKEQFIQSLKDITKAGYKYFESTKATINVFNEDAESFMKVCKEYGVKPNGFYFHFTGDWENDVEDAKRKMPFMAACDIHRMNVQATGTKDHPTTKEELEYDLKVINAIAEASKDYDIIPCMHPHYNTTVMYENEIDFIMNNTDPELVAFGPDTAHLTAGECDPVKVIEKYKDRVNFTHLKDITEDGVQAAGMQGGVEVYSNFRELGQGIVNFPAIFKILDSVNYDGFLTVELDMSRFSHTQSAVMSLKYLNDYYNDN